MYSKSRLTIVFLCAGLLSPAMADNQDSKTVLPAKISKDDATGMIFHRNDRTATTHPDGHQTESVTTMLSSDEKLAVACIAQAKLASSSVSLMV